MHFLPISSLTVCRVSMSPKHKISHSACNILNDRSHVLYLPTEKRFRDIQYGRYDRYREGLWIEFTSNPMRKKRVVRSWATRRVDQAVTGALRMRGFDRNGKSLADLDASTLKGEYAPEALIGTVEVHVLENSIETSFAEVQRQAGVMVDKILEICGRFPRKRKYGRQQEPGTTP